MVRFPNRPGIYRKNDYEGFEHKCGGDVSVPQPNLQSYTISINVYPINNRHYNDLIVRI